MSITAVVGANWGDEGKGKITDALAARSTAVVRYQGGANAGHTIINEYGKFALSLLPSGVFHRGVVNVLGPGVALDAEAFLKEREALIARGVPEPELRISDRAQLVMPYHKLFDRLEEERLGNRGFGSTRKGIAPFYSDKYAKVGVQVADLYDEKRLLERVKAALEPKNVLLEHLYGQQTLNAEQIVAELLPIAEKLRPFVCDTSELLHKDLQCGGSVLVEGQLGALRDPDHGIYPFTTSSSPLAGFAPVGAGVSPHAIERVVAVVKAYSSCVGAGPFTVELDGAVAEELRRRGGDAGEYGAVTGRPRRVGWFDAVATRYGCRTQGATEIALTNLDVLGYLDRIPVCTAYEVDGERTDRFPNSARLDRAKPVWDELPGWKCEISDVWEFGRLPDAARAYISFVEEAVGLPVRWVSVGPKREQLIER